MHIYQRNDGTTTVAGVQCDVNELRVPIGGTPPPGSHQFRTWGANVQVHAAPSTQSPVVHRLPGPTTVNVLFQVHGENVTAEGITGDGWANVPELGGFVSNICVDVSQGWLPGVPECGPPQPTPPHP